MVYTTHMTLYFLTGNQGKLAEAQAVIPTIEGKKIDLPEIQELDPHKIIKAKLQAAFDHHQGSFIVEDTSLFFDGLNGLPGPLVKWFIQAIGNEGLYKMAQAFGVKHITLKTVIGYASDPDNIHYFEGTLAARIVEPRGNQGFGFDPIVMPEGYDQTFGELGSEVKNKISMRRQAFEGLKEFLEA